MATGESSVSDLIEVRVLLFSVLRECVGAGEVALTLPSSATGSDLVDRLVERYPSLDPYRSVVRLAVNRTYASLDTSLHDGDEIALITPVSGG